MGEKELELESPDNSENLDDTTADETSDGTPGPDPSPEANEDEKFDLLSVVREAVPSEADNSESSTEEENDSDDADSADTDSENGTEDGETDEENFSDVPFHNHPRFKQLIAQRNQYKEGATEYAKVQAFLQESGVSAEEAANALNIQSLLKSDPHKAWEELKPIVQQLVRDVGLVLPEDLQQRVAKGEITKEAAAEISRLRSETATAKKQDELRQEKGEQDKQRDAAKAVTDAVASWELEQRKDPDFEAKAEDLMREVVWLQSKEGKPDTPDKATDQLKRAMSTVNKRIAARTKPKPSKETLTGGRTASITDAAEPKSVLDIVKSVSDAG